MYAVVMFIGSIVVFGVTGLVIDLIRKVKSSKTKYPYQSGEVIVLGPELFINNAYDVVCYRGENYYPIKQKTEKTRKY